jgi:hypothetical protein
VGEGREPNPYTPKQGQYLAFIYYARTFHEDEVARRVLAITRHGLIVV